MANYYYDHADIIPIEAIAIAIMHVTQLRAWLYVAIQPAIILMVILIWWSGIYSWLKSAKLTFVAIVYSRTSFI